MAKESRRKTAKQNKFMSDQLKSSSFHFLYELIQNADNSLYTKASKPTLAFEITPSHIFVDTNEDGFTRAKVEEIFNVDESSKAYSPGSNIGQNGVGFKSVFAVTNKVHIQSGPWSFSFNISPEEEREEYLETIKPIYEPPKELPEHMSTRITLELKHNEQHDFKKLIDAVKDLPTTIILFLRKLQQIKICVKDSDGRLECTIIGKTKDLAQGTVHLSRQQSFQNSNTKLPITEKTEYLTFDHEVRNLPADERRKGLDSAPIELAFPVEGGDTKTLKVSELGQHVFAYLPMSRVSQLQFIIQSDFITTENRKSMVADCAWNIAIRKEVPQAFANAVAKFAARDQPLEYSWLEFLPPKTMDKPWEDLSEKVREIIKNMPIFQTWQGRDLKRPSELRFLPEYALHDNAPLFPDDPKDEKYLAHEYGEKKNTLEDIKDLGVIDISLAEILDRLALDLGSRQPKMLERKPDDAWHTSCANLLLKAFEKSESESEKSRIKHMDIIPFIDSTVGIDTLWTSARMAETLEIYFPNTDGVPIPTDLTLRLLEPQAACISKRVDLFRKLGVRDCPKGKVIEEIRSRHQNVLTKKWAKEIRGVDNNLKNHFRYLFNFDENPKSLRQWLMVPTEAGDVLQASHQLYFLSAKEYHTQQLLGNGRENGKDGLAAFIRRELAEFMSPKTRCHNRSWIKWLKEATGARYFPPLGKKGSSCELSPIMLDVLERSPTKFLGLLHEYWDVEYQATVEKHPQMRQTLEKCMVESESGRTYLRHTFIPSDEPKKEAEELEVQNDIPFLRLPSALDPTTCRSQKFFKDLHVNTKPNMLFYIYALGNMSDLRCDAKNKVERAYKSLYSVIRKDEENSLRALFTSYRLVYCPREGTEIAWYTSDDCVWVGPSFLTVKQPLEIHYRSSHEDIKTLFTESLNVRNATAQDVLDEIEATKSQSDLLYRVKIRKATEIYQHIGQTNWDTDDWKLICTNFNKKKLLLSCQGWSAPSSCYWESPNPLVEYQGLNSLYPNLKSLFVEGLGVQIASADFFVEELIKLVEEPSPWVQRIRGIILEIGLRITKTTVDERLADSLQALRKVKFFPIKSQGNASVLLKGLDDDFAIPNHDRFNKAFQGESILLDFSLRETQILHPLFEYFGLLDKCLSVAVKEQSEVPEGAMEDQALSQKLRAKAYALYCCAAKFKSSKAFPDQTELFQQLSQLQLCTSDDISTYLVLPLKKKTLRVKSDRVYMHYNFSQLKSLKLYVPNDPSQRETCYRSQLPKLLCEFLGIDPKEAVFPISLILNADMETLDKVMNEEDIASVSWISKPPSIEITYPEIKHGSSACSTRTDLETLR
ncbi:hypothetical protein K432DRAFT_429408 [Lepidopterella palustris CBS 459.81]|uniref:Sacsin n=1 Tax=Lepidopterella palustris CBS 459.81 TaxID=1314670 RepID=A0A8E2E136_9PEZI|nr:hypothetical protein K432DRAFT_429408 [Lepidopterella palustris CBS 459.81]